MFVFAPSFIAVNYECDAHRLASLLTSTLFVFLSIGFDKEEIASCCGISCSPEGAQEG